MGDFESLERLALAQERPCLALVPATHRSISHLGGLPDLPQELAWPEIDGAPIPFLGQVDLGSAPKQHWPTWMPRDGRLLFFHDAHRWRDPNERLWSVLYVGENSPTFPRLPPSSLPNDRRYARKEVELVVARSFPSYERLKGATGTLTGADFEKMSDFYGAFEDRHQMFGWPSPMQSDDMEIECQLASNGSFEWDQPHDPEIEAQVSEWQLLLQLDSDDDSGMMWGDGGALYFFIRQQDAMRGDFSNVWMVRQ